MIGSDLLWQVCMVPGLINTLKLLFLKNPGMTFYHCYIERSLQLHLELLKSYKENNFIVEYVGHEIIKPMWDTINYYPHLQKIT